MTRRATTSIVATLLLAGAATWQANHVAVAPVGPSHSAASQGNTLPIAAEPAVHQAARHSGPERDEAHRTIATADANASSTQSTTKDQRELRPLIDTTDIVKFRSTQLAAPSPQANIAADQGAAAMPNDWYFNESGQDAYRAHRNTTAAWHGSASLSLRSTVDIAPSGVWGSIAQRADASPYRGQRIRFSAFMTQTGMSARGGIWLRANREGGEYVVFHMGPAHRLIGAQPWRQASLILDIPKDAESLLYGSMLDGLGSNTLDFVAIDVVEPGTPVNSIQINQCCNQSRESRPLLPPRNLDFED